ncbi:unnamed protein product, partial [Candidula unifasciata]
SQQTLWGVAQMFRTRARSFAFVCILVLMVYSGFQVIYMPVEMNICPDPIRGKDFYGQSEENITIVTMYLNLGTHSKTSFFLFSKEKYATDQYKLWLLSWGKLQNKVVAFFDDDEFIKRFRDIRSHLPESYTIITKIDKSQLSAFHQKGRIENIIANPSFTISYPAEYTCTMNAKYDVLDMALKQGLIKSKFMAWMDIGLWRKIQEEDPSYTLKLPPDFNSSKIGFSEVTPRHLLSNLSPVEVYKQNVVWVAGGFVLGSKEVVAEFIISYQKTSLILLDQGLADTDQQVITSMYSPGMAAKQKVEIMTYACPRGSFGLFGYSYLYFCLPYICRASAECKSRQLVSFVGSDLTFEQFEKTHFTKT